LLGEKVIAPLAFPDQIRHVVRHHHERWDGGGYPDGLSGTDIPAAARLFAIADAIDAMTSSRPYRIAVSFDEALKELMSCAGTHFDPDLARLAHQMFLDEPPSVLESQ
jgi:HD-GYP domain-containing protein (c-di-GMP phosphodiesterase class II)